MTELEPRLSSDSLTPGVSGDGQFDEAIANFAASVVRAKTVDPITTEMVRLRCAQIHDCRLCSSVRNEEALDEGFDESLQRKIANYEQGDFEPAVKAALRLCDMMILTPSLAGPELKRELGQYYDAGQIAEIMLDVMKWSQQKALVALRLETPPWDGTLVLSFDEDGRPHFGGLAYGGDVDPA
jgi:hypothetical protein